jgi:hypothetical protein
MSPFQPTEKWEFNTLGIYDYKRPGYLDLWFNFIRLTESLIPGDVVEAGVFRGHTLLATALLLRELGSPKKVLGFDSFRGFPQIPKKNGVNTGNIKSEIILEPNQMKRVQRLNEIKRALQSDSTFEENQRVDLRTISNSGDFSDTQKSQLERKIDFLGLTNVVLVDGYFENTMKSDNLPTQVYASFIDCDLHDSYITTLEAIWPLLSRGSFVYVDEYYSLKFLEAKLAVDSFLSGKNFKRISHSGQIGDDFERNGFIKL